MHRLGSKISRRVKIEKKAIIAKAKNAMDGAKRDYDEMEEDDTEPGEQEKMRKTHMELRKSAHAITEKKENLTSKNYRLKKEINKLKQQMDRIQDASEKKLNNVPRQLRDAYEWTQQTTFKMEVLGPILINIEVVHGENDVDTQNNIKWVENHVVQPVRHGFLAQCKEDLLLLKKTFKKNRWSFQTLETKKFIPNPNKQGSQIIEELTSKNIDCGHLDDLIECPDIIMQTLRNIMGVHNVMWIRQDNLSNGDDITNVCMSQHAKDNTKPRLLYSPKYKYLKGFSNYGSAQNIFTNFLKDIDGKEHFAKSDDSERIKLQDEIQEIEEKIKPLEEEFESLNKVHKTKMSELKKLSMALKELEQKQNAKTTAWKVYENVKRKYEKEVKRLAGSVAEDGRRLKDHISQCRRKRCLAALQINDLMTHVTKIKMQLLPLELSRECSEHVKKSHEQKVNEMEDEIAQHRENVGELERIFTELKQRYKNAEAATTKNAPLSEWEERMADESIPNTCEEIETMILEYEAEIQEVHHNDSVLSEYTQLEKNIDEMEPELLVRRQRLETSHEDRQTKKVEWTKEMLDVTKEIDKSFRVYFQDMGCAGKVEFKLDEDDISKSSLEISVRFRDNVELQPLTSGRQSGGERSVATMFYMLCLQSVATCPFRVVDEINQGMDPKNERRIFDQISKSSVAKETPQYFMVTPKLLPDLALRRNVTILVVFTGIWMCTQNEWDAQKIYKKRIRTA